MQSIALEFDAASDSSDSSDSSGTYVAERPSSATSKHLSNYFQKQRLRGKSPDDIIDHSPARAFPSANSRPDYSGSSAPIADAKSRDRPASLPGEWNHARRQSIGQRAQATLRTRRFSTITFSNPAASTSKEGRQWDTQSKRESMDSKLTGANAASSESYNGLEHLLPNLNETTVKSSVTGVGEEPGIDMETTMVNIPDSVGSQVMIIDFSPENLTISRQDIKLGASSRALDQLLLERPQWSWVRWIIVNGLSWEAIGPVANFYKLHPLALEDLLEIPQRTKVEMYSRQLFCCFPLHILSHKVTPISTLHKVARTIVRAVYYGVVKGFWCSYRSSAGENDNQDQDPQRDSEPGKNSNSQSKRTGSDAEGRCETYQALSSRNWWPSRRRSVKNDVEAGIQLSHLGTLQRISTDSVRTYDDKFSKTNFGVTEETATQHSTWSCDDDENQYPATDYGRCSVNVVPDVVEKISQIPMRSMYQWNRGNDSLEATTKLHIEMNFDGSGSTKHVNIEQVSLFLLEGAVVTFFEKSAPLIFKPIVRRLESPSTMLRASSDPALLVQAILDASVDMLEPVTVEYRSRLSSLQLDGIRRPTLSLTRKLSSLLRDLDLLRTTAGSLAKLTETLGFKSSHTTLKVHNIDSRRSSSVADCNTSRDASSSGESYKERPDYLPREVISETAATYLADVKDHALQYTDDMKTMRNHAKTLLMSIQNEMSIRGGDSIMVLSLVAVIFLPLSFLTGYFGMNFTNFKTLDNDVSYYWTIAAPSAGGLLLLLLWPWVLESFRSTATWVKTQLV